MARFVELDRSVYQRSGFNNYCTVVAIAVACNMDMDKALAWAAKCGRTKRGGFHVAMLFPYYGPRWKMQRRKVNGASLVGIDHCWARKLTIAQFLDRNRTGRFIISTGGHAMAVIDGAIHDFRPKRECTRLTTVFELKVPKRRPKKATVASHQPATLHPADPWEVRYGE